MSDLIERLEKATEGSRELDAAITVALDIRPKWLRGDSGELWVRKTGTPGMPEIAWLSSVIKTKGAGNPTAWHSFEYMKGANVYPNYTTSLDAAMTLVPDDWRVEHIGESLPPVVAWGVELHYRDDDCAIQRVANTPALALCSASLRARSK